MTGFIFELFFKLLVLTAGEGGLSKWVKFGYSSTW